MMNRKAIYRQAARDDVLCIFEMARDFHAESELNDIPFDDAVFARYLEGQIEDDASCIFVAEVSGENVGFIFGSIYQLYFSQTFAANSDIWYVRPEYRGGLIGVLLLRCFEKWAKEKGARFLVNGSSSGISLERTHKLIERLGYESVGSEYRRDLNG
tara:strand:- start:450 stop:920 length:471 start_codon:yes stop_codon:yes gene_type:complete